MSGIEIVRVLLLFLFEKKKRQEENAPVCGTPYVYSGKLKIRPELLAAEKSVVSDGYAAVPHYKKAGQWITLVEKGQISTSLDELHPSEGAALKAGLEWKKQWRSEHQ